MKRAEMKDMLQKDRDRLRTLRDEIRVELHLAGMEANDAWKKLEPKLEEAHRKAVHEIVEQYETFRRSLRRQPPNAA